MILPLSVGWLPPSFAPWTLSELNVSASCVSSRAVLGDDWPLLGNGPHESYQFPGNGHGDHIGVFAS